MSRVHIVHNPAISGIAQFTGSYDVDGWQHRTSANLGFDTASFVLKEEKFVLEDLFLNALGRRVTRYSPDGNFVIWDGYISDMVLAEPGISKQISLREMVNRGSVRYIPIDTTVNPPTESAETSTAVVNNTDSQALYGIKEKYFSPPKVNRLTAADASQYAAVILGQYRQPIRSESLSAGAGEAQLTVNCEGFVHTLEWRIYNQTVSSGTDFVYVVAGSIITAVGQFISSTALEANTSQIQKYYNRDNTALDILQTGAAIGDSSNKRWLFYVLENRILQYHAASTTVNYFRRVVDARQEIFDVNGRSLPFWEIRPNNWLRTSDVLSHLLTPAQLQDDKQSMYIESVQFSEPDSLSLTGSTGERGQVIIARAAGQGDSLL